MERIIAWKEINNMNFLKGTIIGMIAGACIGYMENESICKIMKKGEKEFKKMKRKFGM